MARRKEGFSGGLEDEHGAFFSNLILLEKHSAYPARKREIAMMTNLLCLGLESSTFVQSGSTKV
jgi:hypothetical protein